MLYNNEWKADSGRAKAKLTVCHQLTTEDSPLRQLKGCTGWRSTYSE